LGGGRLEESNRSLASALKNREAPLPTLEKLTPKKGKKEASVKQTRAKKTSAAKNVRLLPPTVQSNLEEEDKDEEFVYS
jgi:hypothetical protein